MSDATESDFKWVTLRLWDAEAQDSFPIESDSPIWYNVPALTTLIDYQAKDNEILRHGYDAQGNRYHFRSPVGTAENSGTWEWVKFDNEACEVTYGTNGSLDGFGSVTLVPIVLPDQTMPAGYVPHEYFTPLIIEDYATQISNSTPYAHYEFNENSVADGQDCVDTSGNNRTALYLPGVTQVNSPLHTGSDKHIWVAGGAGYCGVAAPVQPDANWTAFTVNAWVIFEDNSEAFSYLFDSQNFTVFYAAEGSVRARMKTFPSENIYEVQSTADIGTYRDQPLMVTAVYSHPDLTLYINGAQIATIAADGGQTGLMNEGVFDSGIGALYATDTYVQKGPFDSMTFWDRAITANEINNLYLGGTA